MGKNNIISQVVNTAIDIVEQVSNTTKLHSVSIVKQQKKDNPTTFFSIIKKEPTVQQIKVFKVKKNSKQSLNIQQVNNDKASTNVHSTHKNTQQESTEITPPTIQDNTHAPLVIS